MDKLMPMKKVVSQTARKPQPRHPSSTLDLDAVQIARQGEAARKKAQYDAEVAELNRRLGLGMSRRGY